MMNKINIKGVMVMFAAFWAASSLCACKEFEDRANVDRGSYKWLALNQAREVWNGTECNSSMGLKEGDNADTTITINTSLYLNQKADNDCKADIVINSDSLNKAIALVSTGGVYAKYANAVLMPTEAYSLSSKEITLKAGQTKSDDVTITIHRGTLLANPVRNENTDAFFVLPISLKNSSDYKINDKVSTMMLYVTLPTQDPTKPDETSPKLQFNGKTLVWNDEFNGTGKPDGNKWSFENGFQRNHEDQWYQADNAYLDGKGACLIEGRKERVNNPNYQSGSSDWKQNRQYAEYTSASMQSKYIYKYGTVLVRAKIPTASGSWPAIWQVGNTWEWPLGGEIDILESYPSGGVPAIHANYCWGSDKRWSGNWQSKVVPMDNYISKDKDWASKYHIWRLDWTSDSLKIYIDDELINEISTSKTVNGNGGGAPSGGGMNPFSNTVADFGDLIWLNLALGGDNGGSIDNSAFPMKYCIDYVRVYQ